MKPDAFAAVMATGIVSVAGYAVVGTVLAVLAAAALPVLAAVAAATWRRAPLDLSDSDGIRHPSGRLIGAGRLERRRRVDAHG